MLEIREWFPQHKQISKNCKSVRYKWVYFQKELQNGISLCCNKREQNVNYRIQSVERKQKGWRDINEISLLLHEKEFLNSYSRWMTSIYPYHPVLLSISLKQKLKHMCKSTLSKEETNKSKFRGGLVAKTFCKS